MTAWKQRIQERTLGSRVLIPKQQIDIIKATIVAFEKNQDNDE